MAQDYIQLGGRNIKAFNVGDGGWALATEQQPYTTVVTGEVIAGTASTAFGNVPVKYVHFKAPATNSGTVYVGGTLVTAANGTADTTTGLPLGAGETSHWISIDNLNRMAHIASAASQRLIYYGTL